MKSGSGKKRGHNRRKGFGIQLSDPAVQSFIALEFFVFIFTMIFLIYLIPQSVEEAINQVSQSGSSDELAIISQAQTLLLIRIPLLFLGAFLVNVLLGLFYLHRLLGPLHRVATVLNQLSGGKMPQESVSFRREDYPKEIGNALGRLISAITSRRH